jgi:hypothetical protein
VARRPNGDDRGHGDRPADGRGGAAGQALRRRDRRLPASERAAQGVVEAAIKYTTRSCWRTARVATLGDAQRDFDGWCFAFADPRKRPGGTVGQPRAEIVPGERETSLDGRPLQLIRLTLTDDGPITSPTALTCQGRLRIDPVAPVEN